MLQLKLNKILLVCKLDLIFSELLFGCNPTTFPYTAWEHAKLSCLWQGQSAYFILCKEEKLLGCEPGEGSENTDSGSHGWEGVFNDKRILGLVQVTLLENES